MSSDDAAFAALQRANPVPRHEVNRADADGRAALARLLGSTDLHAAPSVGSGMAERRSTTSGGDGRRTAMLATAASMVAVMIASLALFVSARSGESPGDRPSASTIQNTVVTALPLPIPPDPTALTVVQAFVDRYNDGDLDAVLESLSNDVVSSLWNDTLETTPNTATAVDRAEVEGFVAFEVAQRTQLSGLRCDAEGPGEVSEATLRCRWSSFTALTRALDATPTPVSALISVTDGRITGFHLAQGQPNYSALRIPFESWLEEYHPDVSEMLGQDGDSVAVGTAQGAATADWAPQWAMFLELYGCEARAFCTIEVDRWVDEYNRQCPRSTDRPNTALVEHMRSVPPTVEMAKARRSLMEVDAALVGLGEAPDDASVPELLQRRDAAMVELGIDDDCRPVDP